MENDIFNILQKIGPAHRDQDFIGSGLDRDMQVAADVLIFADCIERF
jgi:hypothetical protein